MVYDIKYIYIKRLFDFFKLYIDYNLFYVVFIEMLSGLRCCEVNLWQNDDNDWRIFVFNFKVILKYKKEVGFYFCIYRM